jgi:GDP-L-fucose synthase
VNLYGPHDNFSIKNGHVIPAIMNRFHGEKSKKDGKFTPYGTGQAYRQFLFAKDFAKIMCDVLLDKKYNNTEPLICCNDETTIKEMVGSLADAMDISRDKLEWDINKSDGCMKKTVDNSKLCKYYPDFKFTSLQDGLKETYKWFCDNQETLRQ